jgi:uncharacterized protein YebE (UPF0316 family)
MSPLVLFLLIVGVRTLSVTFGYLRNIYRFRLQILAAFVASIVEVSLWILIISKAFSQIREHPGYAVVYGIGFAIGSILGLLVEKILPLGNAEIILFAPEELRLSDAIHASGFAATAMAGKGLKGPVEVILCYILKRDVKRFLAGIPKDNRIFYTVDYGIRSSKITKYM